MESSIESKKKTPDPGTDGTPVFPERLTRVLEAANELSKIDSLDNLYRRSMELALERLGFDRIGLCFLSENHGFVTGVYGTDESGYLRDEKHLIRAVENTPTVKSLLEKDETVLFFQSEILFNDKVEQVGIGDHAVARLWNGESVIGILAVDNLIRKQPITPEDLKILDVYASALGHLITLKHTQHELIESENRFRTLFEQIAVGIAQVEVESGQILRVNRRFSIITGYSEEELKDFTLTQLVHEQDLEAESGNLRNLEAGEIKECDLDLRFMHRNGSFIWVNLTLSPLEIAPGHKYGIAAIQDISERKSMEEQIRKDIEEKNILIQEIHHRVKNNMQIIVSLLNLQASRIEDPVLLSHFSSSKDRIYSMSLVHEMLYQSRQLTRIDFKRYIEKLSRTVIHSFNSDTKRIRLETELESIQLNVDRAIPCGLIVQELLSNAVKHAFPGNPVEKAVIRIVLRQDNGEIELIISDNGIGLPRDLDMDRLPSLGFKLLHVLGKDQLGGTLKIESEKGTKITLRFKDKKDKHKLNSILHNNEP